VKRSRRTSHPIHEVAGPANELAEDGDMVGFGAEVRAGRKQRYACLPFTNIYQPSLGGFSLVPAEDEV